ncbi:hypothetical protein [Rhodopila globiformis]|uniref:Lipoprotein n=1 Tax=Rhodopila globiformis TaxID=1071 RepID=A0A2S6N7S3_RHOGL|nr:hypothetical protein [Rhodopila globiformis]PPQ30658.1 hypothetical protein CCS01_18755 [Rhodopila globiformis]
MPVRLRPIACLSVPALLLGLSGCGGAGPDQFAPPCPSARLIPELSDMTRYAGKGPAHDLTDLIVQAHVMGVKGSCSAGDDKSVLPAKVQVTIAVQRGPAMRGREADVPVFLAVTEGETVRDKQVFPVHVVFPPNVDRLTMTSQDIDLALPVSARKTGAAYGIIAGFQLTPDELAANRRAAGQ